MVTKAITIRTDEDTNAAIRQYAKSLGMSTSTFVAVILKKAIREKQLVLTPVLEPTPYLEEIMKTADKDIESDKNLPPVYDNADDFLKDLE